MSEMINKGASIDLLQNRQYIIPIQINGFTLIEVMVSMLLLLVGIFAYLQLQLTAIRVNEASKQLMIARDVVSQELEIVKSAGYIGIKTSSTLTNSSTFGFTANYDSLPSKNQLPGIDKSCNAPASYCVYKGLTVTKKINNNPVNYYYTLKLSVNPNYLTYPSLAEVDAQIYWLTRGDLKNIRFAAFVGI